MQLTTEMAVNAVSAALSKLHENDTALYPCDVDDMVLELTWMHCFLLVGDGLKPPVPGKRKKVADVWSPAIERLALRALHLRSQCLDDDDVSVNLLIIEKLTKKLSNLREKIQQFISNEYTPETAVKVAAAVPKKKNIIKVAAWGGPGGKEWKFVFDGTLKQITIVNGEVIDSIAFTSLKPDGSLKTLKVGGNGGFQTNQVNINGASERLRGIKGTYGFFLWYVVIRSISFRTNLKTYGPYGSKDGAEFEHEIEEDDGGEEEIVGFHGRFGGQLDAFGLYIQR